MNVWVRVVLVLFGLFESSLGIWILVHPPRQPANPRGTAAGFIVLPVGMIAIGIAVFGYRKRSDADDLPFAPDGWPRAAERERLIVGERIGIDGRYVRLMLDPAKRIVYFERSHTENKMLATPAAFFSCSADDVLCAQKMAARGGPYLHILTTIGGCDFYGPPIDALESGLRSMGVPKIGGSELHGGLTMHVLMWYGLAGFILALIGMTPQMGDFEFYGRLALGGAIGAGGAALLIQLGQMLFGLRLALPMLAALIGAVGGAFGGGMFGRTLDSEFMRQFLGRDYITLTIVVGAGIGAAAGAAVGGFIQRHRERSTRATALLGKKTIPEI